VTDPQTDGIVVAVHCKQCGCAVKMRCDGASGWWTKSGSALSEAARHKVPRKILFIGNTNVG